MKRSILIIMTLTIFYSVYAGGIITNTNQSVRSVRMQANDATTLTDATYFNPAGLTFLPNNGFFLSLNNQTVIQNRTVKTDYANLNTQEYKGKVLAPLFPGIYAAYKKDKLAFSLGFNPIGGGGGGTYDNGLPSFEYDISDLPIATGADGYSMDAYFEGQSVYFGLQGNVSYQINDKISIALGARYVMAKESYNGYLKDISLNFGGASILASDYFLQTANSLTTAEAGVQGIITAGGGTYTFAQLVAADQMTAEQRSQLEGGLLQMGLDQTQIDALNMNQVLTYYSTAVAQNVPTLTAYSQILSDQEADYEKTATGVTPIVSIDIKPSDKLNLAIRYEFNTKLEFTNKTTKDLITGFDPVTGDPITMFPDGEKSRLDIPAQLVVGGSYKIMDNLEVAAGFHYYFDKNADWGGREKYVDSGLWEFMMGFEYGINDALKASIGYLRTQAGVQEAYQTDLSQAMPSNTICGGFAYQLNDMIGLEIGGQYTNYVESERNFFHDLGDTGLSLPVKETYSKPVLILAVGANFNFSAGK